MASNQEKANLQSVPAPPAFMQMVAVDITGLQNEIRRLEEENKSLKAILAEKDKLLGETVAKHQDQLVDLQARFDESRIQFKDLLDKHQSLLEENRTLKSLVETLSCRLKKLEEVADRVPQLEQQIQGLIERDHPITVREAMIVLEQHMCIAIAGSKKKARKGLNTIKRVSKSKDPEIETRYKSYLEDKGLTTDHLDTLIWLKEDGNNAAHVRPDVSVDVLLKMAINDDDEEDEVALKRKIFELLSSIAPKNSEGHLVLQAPLK